MNPQPLKSQKLFDINCFSMSYHTIIQLEFPGTFDLMSLKVEICFGQYAVMGILTIVSKKNNSQSVRVKINL